MDQEAGTFVRDTPIQENLDKDLTHAFTLTFHSQEDLDAYITHAAHRAFRRQARRQGGGCVRLRLLGGLITPVEPVFVPE